jgi:hypothetical protein
MLTTIRRRLTHAALRAKLLRTSRKRLDGIRKERPELGAYRLPPEVAAKIATLWPDATTVRLATRWGEAYALINGIVDHRYVPGYAFAVHVRSVLNREALAEAYTDKNALDRLFPDAPTPPTLLRRIHGRSYGPGYEPLEDVAAALDPYEGEDVVVKPALESGGGQGVWVGTYRSGAFERPGEEPVPHGTFLAERGANVVVQPRLPQHAHLARFHPASLNTLRILTLRHDPDLTVLSTVARFGGGGSRVDNQAAGGVSSGVAADGRLNGFAVDKQGRRFERHPTTEVPFEGASVPGVAAAHDLVLACHARLLHFDVVSWDVAIGVDGAPVLIEFNLLAQEIAFHQMNNGPLFGDLTDEVLARARAHGR